MALDLLETKYLKSFKHLGIAHNGFLYTYQKTCNQQRQWKCNRSTTMVCPSVLRTTTDLLNLEFIAIDHDHIHEDDMAMINDLKNKMDLAQNKQHHLFTIKPKEKRTIDDYENINNNKKQKLIDNSEEIVCAPSTSSNVQIQINDTSGTIQNTETQNNFKSELNSLTDNQNCDLEIGDDINIDTDFDFNLTDVDLNVDFDFDTALTFAAINENAVTDHVSINDDQCSNENQVEDAEKIDLILNDNNDIIVEESDVDNDTNIIYCRENWPSICRKLSNPAIGMEVFKNILIQKMSDYLTRTSELAKDRYKLCILKRRQFYWVSKFIAAYKQLKILNEQTKENQKKVDALSRTNNLRKNEMESSSKVFNISQPYQKNIDSDKKDLNSQVIDLTDDIEPSEPNGPVTLQNAHLISPNPSCNRISGVNSDSNRTITTNKILSKQSNDQSMISQNADIVSQNQNGNCISGIYTDLSGATLTYTIISNHPSESVMTSQNPNLVSLNLNSNHISCINIDSNGDIFSKDPGISQNADIVSQNQNGNCISRIFTESSEIILPNMIILTNPTESMISQNKSLVGPNQSGNSIYGISKTDLLNTIILKEVSNSLISQNTNLVFLNKNSNSTCGIYNPSGKYILPKKIISKQSSETEVSQNANLVFSSDNSNLISDIFHVPSMNNNMLNLVKDKAQIKPNYIKKQNIPYCQNNAIKTVNLTSGTQLLHDQHIRTTISTKHSEERTQLNSSTIPVPLKTTLPDVVCQTNQSKECMIIDLTEDSDSTDINHGNNSVANCNPVPLAIPILPPQLKNCRLNKVNNPIQTFTKRPICPPMLKFKVEILCSEKDFTNVQLTWDFHSNIKLENPIESYELYCYEATSNTSINNKWTLIGYIAALPLPMACTLKLANVQNKKHYFSIRAKDRCGEYGPFSAPKCTNT